MKILNIVKNYGLSQTNKTDENLIKSIKRKDDMSFVIAYRLLEDKMKKEKGVTAIKEANVEENKLQIFPETNNEITQPENPKQEWSYGKTFKATAKNLMKAVISILEEFNTTVFIKGKSHAIQPRATEFSVFMSSKS